MKSNKNIDEQSAIMHFKGIVHIMQYKNLCNFFILHLCFEKCLQSIKVFCDSSKFKKHLSRI